MAVTQRFTGSPCVLRMGPPWISVVPAGGQGQGNRYAWWRKRGLGKRCWELDALDPNMLRHVVSEAIAHYVDMDAWNRCKQTEAAGAAP